MIVDGIGLSAEPSRILGLIGPNGSGKPSLLRLLCRLRKVASGVVTLDTRDIAGLARCELARRLAFVEQHATTDVQLTVCDVVRLGRTPHRLRLLDHGRRAGSRCRTGAGWPRRAARPALAHAVGARERQRVHIARALAQEPRELILDEPTNHLDIQHQLAILGLVRRLGITCVVELHDLNLASLFCDQIGVMSAGRLAVSGRPESVLVPDPIQEVFGVEVIIREGAAGRRHLEYVVDFEDARDR